MRRHQPTPRRARGFTLAEILISILIIAVLMGLLLVGFSNAIRSARRTALTQDVASLDMAVQQFRSDFNFVPPLVIDGFPDTPGANDDPLIDVDFGNRQRRVPNVYSITDTNHLSFLRGETDDPRYRFSNYSLPYYIMGALGKDVDGVEGPGAKEPSRDGAFNLLTNDTYQPLFDPKSGSLESVEGQAGRIELRDANAVSIRYYRWARGTMQVGDNDTAVLNVPELAAAGAAAESLGDAEYAIIAAGPDGVFGDIDVMTFAPDGPAETRDTIEAELGKRFRDDAEAAAAARADNVVRAGR